MAMTPHDNLRKLADEVLADKLNMPNARHELTCAGAAAILSLLNERDELRQEVERLRGQNAALGELAEREHDGSCGVARFISDICTCDAGTHNARVAELLKTNAVTPEE
jgi:hypothetical protein